MTSLPETHRWNVIFLLDANPPRQIVLLKRASWKTFAPNLYTGIGGHVEVGEDPTASAIRELKEETGLELPLTQFAQSIVNNQNVLDYFWAVFDSEIPECNEGTLKWVPTEEILNKDLIPTAQYVIEEWAKRRFKLSEPWTLKITRDDIHDLFSQVTERKVVTGILV